jgi:outer membrane protein assembly factor BamB
MPQRTFSWIGLVAALSCALAAFASLPPALAQVIQPMFRGGPALTGVYGGPAPRRLTGVRFTYDAGAPLRNAPAISGGALFFGAASGIFRALNAQTGEVLWSTDVGSSVTSSPAVVGRSVFFTTRDGTIHALSTRSGRPIWSASLGRDDDALNYWDFFTSSPTPYGDKLYVGSGDGGLYALDQRSGRVIWRATIGSRVRSTPAVTADVVVVGSQGGEVFAIDRATGAQRWRFATDGASHEFELRYNDTTSVYASPTIANGIVAIGARDGNLYGIDLQTGAQAWKTTHDGGSWILSTATADGALYVGSGSALIIQAADMATGAERWRAPATAAVFGSPTIIGDVLLYADMSGSLRALDRASGGELWRLNMADRAFSTPVAADGIVYASSDAGVLYALNSSPTPSSRAGLRRLAYRAGTRSDAVQGWFQNGVDHSILGFFTGRGFENIDADNLRQAMTDQIAGASRSVVVFADNHAPSNVLETEDESALLRRYLEAGGAVVFLSDNPVAIRFSEDGALDSIDEGIAENVLGLHYPRRRINRGPHVSRATEIGLRWGSRPYVVGGRVIGDDQVTAVLGRDEFGMATSWMRTYGANGGFVLQLNAPQNRMVDFESYANMIEFALSNPPN